MRRGASLLLSTRTPFLPSAAASTIISPVLGSLPVFIVRHSSLDVLIFSITPRLVTSSVQIKMRVLFLKQHTSHRIMYSIFISNIFCIGPWFLTVLATHLQCYASVVSIGNLATYRKDFARESNIWVPLRADHVLQQCSPTLMKASLLPV